MSSHAMRLRVPLLAAALFVAPLAVRAADPARVPAALRPPDDQRPALEAHAKGVQIYQCASAGDPARFEWVFKAPEAELVDVSGKAIAKHYAGPTWEAPDGSAVVGEVKAKDAGPDANAIPWLLLNAKETRGKGVFSGVKSIQRLDTVGGKAPATACGRDNAQELARVPYEATYTFFVAKP